MKKNLVFVLLMLVFATSLATAENYSIDISIKQQEPVSVGENLTFEVRLLEDNNPVSKQVTVYFSDALDKKEITKTLASNEYNSFLIEQDFPSGLWNIKAIYEDNEGDITFSVAENLEVEFIIEEDKLIIKNKGNVRYTKTIEIIIGDKRQTKTLNIKVGGQKEWKLIAPEGSYDIKVSDGEKTLNKQAVQLFGTGNVVGAIDESIIGTGLLGGPSDPDALEGRVFSLSKLPLALVFVGAVLGLGVLLLVEKRVRKKRGE